MKYPGSIPHGRAGYLFEFPLMACAAGILAGILAPLLPEPWNLLPWALFVLILVAWFVYSRFFPGWRPGRAASVQKPSGPVA